MAKKHGNNHTMIDWLLQTTEVPNWIVILSGGVYGFAAGILISPPRL